MALETANIPAAELDALEEFARTSAGPELRDVLLALSRAARDGSQFSVVAETVLSPNRAAERLGMSRTHLYKLLDRGEIVFHRVGRDRRIRVSDLIAFEARRQRDRRELAERFASQDRTRGGVVDEIADGL